jgi:hypothetical protein
MNKITSLKWQTRFRLGVSPDLFYPAYRVYYRVNAKKLTDSDRFVRENTGLVIEGFPRSANTSTVAHFQAFNPGVRVAHHHHVPAQISRAIELGIPALVLVRDPEEAISSFQCFEPDLPLETAIHGYCSFYKTLLPHAGNFSIAPFDRLFEDFDGIIDRVNRKFETRFSIGVPLPRRRTNREPKMPYLQALRQPEYRTAMDRAFELYETYSRIERQSRQKVYQTV